MSDILVSECLLDGNTFEFRKNRLKIISAFCSNCCKFIIWEGGMRKESVMQFLYCRNILICICYCHKMLSLYLCKYLSSFTGSSGRVYLLL